jgi:tRNA threonylcarbamoyladenosine biosynthesis protein TsaB
VKILALETATEVCSVAITENEQLLAEGSLNVNRAHSEKLMEFIRTLSDALQLSLNQIDLLAVSKGPGSFTGLRIGIASAKGLAYALNRPLVGVNTLEALTAQLPIKAGLICPLIKARQDEVYTSLFEKLPSITLPIRVGEDHVLKIDALKNFVPTNATLIGNGVIAFQSQLQEIFGESVFFAPPYFSMLKAFSTAWIGGRQYHRNPVDELQSLEPFYIQEFKISAKFRTPSVI